MRDPISLTHFLAQGAKLPCSETPFGDTSLATWTTSPTALPSSGPASPTYDALNAAIVATQLATFPGPATEVEAMQAPSPAAQEGAFAAGSS